MLPGNAQPQLGLARQRNAAGYAFHKG